MLGVWAFKVWDLGLKAWFGVTSLFRVGISRYGVHYMVFELGFRVLGKKTSREKLPASAALESSIGSTHRKTLAA